MAGMTTLEASHSLPTGLFPPTSMFYGNRYKTLAASQDYIMWYHYQYSCGQNSLEGNAGTHAGERSLKDWR